MRSLLLPSPMTVPMSDASNIGLCESILGALRGNSCTRHIFERTEECRDKSQVSQPTSEYCAGMPSTEPHIGRA
jgi:hypothetical protein